MTAITQVKTLMEKLTNLHSSWDMTQRVWLEYAGGGPAMLVLDSAGRLVVRFDGVHALTYVERSLLDWPNLLTPEHRAWLTAELRKSNDRWFADTKVVTSPDQLLQWQSPGIDLTAPLYMWDPIAEFVQPVQAHLSVRNLIVEVPPSIYEAVVRLSRSRLHQALGL